MMLVLALDGPEHPGAHEDGEPAALNVARQLTDELVDVATWLWLAPLTVSDLERWTGPCAPGLLSSLLEITSGHGGWSTLLWRDWCEHDVVEQTTDGR